ncbi:hypothetical protein TcasGA2_TC004025 [Tribolium castaneum]|uniref:Uncharacterized protein n=1 Tax=Tribolium castaneum TaxID=7070 RepID=D6WIV4_TRICA|nr:hypothetical protein TcasGA2_TC004025 [Tribolium castaneum]
MSSVTLNLFLLVTLLLSFLCYVSTQEQEEQEAEDNQLRKTINEAVNNMNGLFSKQDLCQMLEKMQDQGYVETAKKYLSYMNINSEEIYPLFRQYLNCDSEN